VSKVFLNTVENEAAHQFKNVGVVLIKAILQDTYDFCEGRMLLESVRATASYYHKLGFQFCDPKMETEMNEALALSQNVTKLNKDLGAHYMYLPEEARDLWVREIDGGLIGLPNP